MVKVIGEVIAEGKTKRIIRPFKKDRSVIIESKDDITAGDGVRHDVIEGKGAISNVTTCNVFRYLNAKGVKTHFMEQIDARSFRAVGLSMIPIECVWRQVAYGSYLKRNPDCVSGTFFDEPVVELFLKDDARHDPMMIWHDDTQSFLLYNPKQPTMAGWIDELFPGQPGPYEMLPISTAEINTIISATKRVGQLLKEAWAAEDVLLVDFKIEFGWSLDENILLGDVIDADSWRIWPAGQEAEMKDKQVYRNLTEPTPEALAQIKGNFQWIMDATGRFITRV